MFDTIMKNFYLSILLGAVLFAGCENKVTNATLNTCAYISSGGIATFTDELVNVCDFTSSDGKWDGFCYHNPDGGPNIFNS